MYNGNNQNGYVEQQSAPINTNVPINQTELSGAPKVFSIVSLVCGIVSMATLCYGMIFSIPAIVFSIIAKVKYKGKNTKATLGLVFGIVGFVLSIIWIVVFALFFAMLAKSTSSYSSTIYY